MKKTMTLEEGFLDGAWGYRLAAQEARTAGELTKAEALERAAALYDELRALHAEEAMQVGAGA